MKQLNYFHPLNDTFPSISSQRIKQLQVKSDDPSLQLRVSVDGGGCSGFQYHFEMQPEVKEEDDM